MISYRWKVDAYLRFKKLTFDVKELLKLLNDRLLVGGSCTKFWKNGIQEKVVKSIFFSCIKKCLKEIEQFLCCQCMKIKKRLFSCL